MKCRHSAVCYGGLPVNSKNLRFYFQLCICLVKWDYSHCRSMTQFLQLISFENYKWIMLQKHWALILFCLNRRKRSTAANCSWVLMIYEYIISWKKSCWTAISQRNCVMCSNECFIVFMISKFHGKGCLKYQRTLWKVLMSSFFSIVNYKSTGIVTFTQTCILGDFFWHIEMTQQSTPRTVKTIRIYGFTRLSQKVIYHFQCTKCPCGN